ncbi:hypothetical protein C4D60_Mb06t07950 [Musa balbisiana]|uniref:Dolichol-phosphate mannosyltransferase subunit 3 n=1 Tax=Musa balbisiana TaxID=52838 RepID=A0A4S8ILG7_MUSBA|nr:hypothetical protein C4D60_Mb06t07950 [Musa balbisiana]
MVEKRRIERRGEDRRRKVSVDVNRRCKKDRSNSLQVIVVLTMKHILKIMALVVVVAGLWIGLLQTSVVPRSYTWLLPVYLIISLGCYGLLMVGIGLILFPTCPQEAVLLQKDIVEAKEFLTSRGVDVGSD